MNAMSHKGRLNHLVQSYGLCPEPLTLSFQGSINDWHPHPGQSPEDRSGAIWTRPGLIPLVVCRLSSTRNVFDTRSSVMNSVATDDLLRSLLLCLISPPAPTPIRQSRNALPQRLPMKPSLPQEQKVPKFVSRPDHGISCPSPGSY